MTADKYILNYKYHGVIVALSKRERLPLRKAFDVFYRSIIYKEMREGISDMHCRSDEYLAEEIKREIKDK